MAQERKLKSNIRWAPRTLARTLSVTWTIEPRWSARRAGRNLIRVATTCSPAQAVPVSGIFEHDGASFLGMDGEVSVTRVD